MPNERGENDEYLRDYSSARRLMVVESSSNQLELKIHREILSFFATFLRPGRRKSDRLVRW